MKYVDIQKRWKSVKKHYESPEAESIWKPEMALYGEVRNWEPNEIQSIEQFDSCDWRYCRGGRKGPQPAYWRFVCHSACHWVCNLHLHVARLAEPKIPWRIVSSHKHSTVWDGFDRLWDGNFLALGVGAGTAWKMAANEPESIILPVGVNLRHGPSQYRNKKYRRQKLDSLAKPADPQTPL